MKAITLWEPWATAMALGLKRNETRSWSHGHRGDLVICSAKRKMDQLGFNLCLQHKIPLQEIRYGYALCIVEVTGTVLTDSIAEMTLNETEYALGDYSYGRFAWITTNLRPLKPFPVIGRQGFFEVDLPK